MAMLQGMDESASPPDLAERYRRAVDVHCYRMFGSFQDAEDAVQDTTRKAPGLPADDEDDSNARGVASRSIATTNTCPVPHLPDMQHRARIFVGLSRRDLPCAEDPSCTSIHSPYQILGRRTGGIEVEEAIR